MFGPGLELFTSFRNPPFMRRLSGRWHWGLQCAVGASNRKKENSLKAFQITESFFSILPPIGESVLNLSGKEISPHLGHVPKKPVLAGGLLRCQNSLEIARNKGQTSSFSLHQTLRCYWVYFILTIIDGQLTKRDLKFLKNV